ncbi:MAG: Fic family protein [Deltaproteobacteria bacterium]|nr:Fic family protein [Deltaproteobacteria bacterium]
MQRGPTGKFVVASTVGNETVRAFVPNPLPPKPPLEIDESLRDVLDHALLALGRLDSLSTLLPATNLFLYMYVRKEAVVSSQIEGTQSSLSDLLLYELKEAPGVPLDDVAEVSNYVAALEYGLKRLKEKFPLSNRLIREIHKILLSHGRGSDKSPGEFRRSQNWIGGTRPGNAVFVPPPPEKLPEALSALEMFLHDRPGKTPVLIKAALAHVQFETIHPFLDGNGRVGRLLIPLMLCSEGILQEPLLYLSLYFKIRRREYYDFLNRVRVEGDWEGWLRFFAEGVSQMAENAVVTARRLVDLISEDKNLINGLGRPSGSCLQIHQILQRRPINTIGSLSKGTGLSVPTVTSGLQAMIKAGLVEEITGRRRHRIFKYTKYLEIIYEGTG